MTLRVSASLRVAVMSAIVLLAFQQVSSGQTPPTMGGGYTNVTSIPVNDPAIKAIGGALFKPAGAGPFPAVVYMTVCGGIDGPLPRAVQKTTTDHLLAKGVAILIVDSFTPRGEPSGVCANLGPLDEEKAIQYAKRGSNDAVAAVAVLKAASRSVAIRRCSRPIRRTPRARTTRSQESSPIIRSVTTALTHRFPFSS